MGKTVRCGHGLTKGHCRICSPHAFCIHDRRVYDCGLCLGVGAYRAHLYFAKRRNLNTELTHTRFLWLIQQPCAYCSAPSGGIDRVKNEYGYTVLNSIPCCRTCNFLKGRYSAPAFVAATAAVATHSSTYEQFKTRWIETRTTGPDLTCQYTSTAAATVNTPPRCLSKWAPSCTAPTAAASSINRSHGRAGLGQAAMGKVVERAPRRKANNPPRPPKPELAARPTE